MGAPKKAVAYAFGIGVVDAAARPSLLANAPIANGDFKVSTDFGNFANLSTQPSVLPSAGYQIKIDLSSAEMNGDNVSVVGHDPGAIWDDIFININPTIRTVDDLAVAGDAMALTSGERTSVADVLLDRNMATGTDSGSSTVRTVRQALRLLRNKWTLVGTTLTVTKEDDATASYTATVGTTAGAAPVTSVDPAGP